jgi:transcriptional regulator with XRE-family HTH domain
MQLSQEEVLLRFGKQVSSIRKSKKLTLRELADRCNIDYSKIGKIEKGKINVTLFTLVDLANGLLVQPKKLLEFDAKE